MLLAPSCCRVLKLICIPCILQSTKWSAADSLLFSQRWHYSSNLWSFSGPQIWLIFWVCSLAICQTLLMLLSRACRGAAHRVGGIWMRHTESWGCLWAILGDFLVSNSQQHMDRLLDAICTAVIICAPLMSSKIPICCYRRLFLPLTHGAPNLVLWLGWRGNEPLWNNSTWLGKLDAHLYALHFPNGINHGSRMITLGPRMCLLGEWVT